ncbi:MAG TPA: UbiA prenyltransferase family protein [Spirochaetia bacterium]|nr:UbiA prenyltransferase family protein [Spirochaetia bacterium]
MEHRLRSLVALVRPAHWIKNGFVLAPTLFAFHMLPALTIVSALAAMAAFSLASSTVYILNDLADRDRDRVHPQKRRRPIASGAVAGRTAVVILAGCAAASAALCLFLPWKVGAFIAGYVALNLAYTWGLKRVILLDVMSIAAGFMLRILAGGAAAGVVLSPWMLQTAFFLSLFLGFTKRMSELLTVAPSGRRPVVQRYSRGFLILMVGMFVSLTIITYSLYVFFPRASSSGSAGLFYTVPLVVYGLLRYVYLAMQRREGGDVAEAIRHDLPLIICIGAWVALVVALVGLRL